MILHATQPKGGLAQAGGCRSARLAALLVRCQQLSAWTQPKLISRPSGAGSLPHGAALQQQQQQQQKDQQYSSHVDSDRRSNSRGTAGSSGSKGNQKAYDPARLINSRITRAETVEDLAATFQTHEQHLDSTHLSTFFVRLAGLVGGSDEQQQWQLAASTPQQYSNRSNGKGRGGSSSSSSNSHLWQRSDPSQLLELLQRRVLSEAHQLTARHVANIVWALAKIHQGSTAGSGNSSQAWYSSHNGSCQSYGSQGGHRRPSPAAAVLPELLTALQRRARELFGQGTFTNPQELSMLAYGLSLLRPQQQQPLQPALGIASSISSSIPSMHHVHGVAAGTHSSSDASELQQLLSRLCCASSRQLHRFNAQDLSNTIYALAKLNHEPPGAWMDAWTARATQQLPWFTPQALSNSAWALAKLKQQRPEWMAACMGSAAEAASARTLNAQEACNLLWAAGEMQADVPDAVIGELLRCLRPLLPSCSPQDLASVMYALARLQAAPGVTWTEAFFAAATEQLPAFDANALSITLWALAELGLPGGAAWKLAVLARFRSQLPRASPRQLSMVVRAAAALGWVLPQRWLACFLAECKPRLGRFGPCDVADTAWALATLRAPCDARWLDWLLVHTLPQLPRFDARELSVLAWSVARLGHHPADAWMGALLEASAQHLDAAAVAFRLSSGASSGASSSSICSSSNSSNSRVGLFSHSSSSTSSSNSSSSSSSSHIRGSSGCSSGFGAGWGCHPAANLIWALARLEHQPSPNWLSSYYAATGPLLDSCSAAELCAISHALSKLGVRPPGVWTQRLAAAVRRRFADFGAGEVLCTLRALRLLGDSMHVGIGPAAGADGGAAVELSAASIARAGSGALTGAVSVSNPTSSFLSRVQMDGLGELTGVQQQQQQQQQRPPGSIRRVVLTPAQLRQRARQRQQPQQEVQEPLWMDTFVTEAYSFAALASLMPPALKARCMQWPRLLVADKRGTARLQMQARAPARAGV